MSHGGHGGHAHSAHGAHHAHHHGVHGGGHPDQLPNWNMAMQGQSQTSFFKKLNLVQLMLPLFLLLGGIGWLCVIYTIHHQDAVRDHTNVLDLRQTQRATDQPQTQVFASTNYSRPAFQRPESAASAVSYPARFGSPRVIYAGR